MIGLFVGSLALGGQTAAVPAVTTARWALEIKPARCLLEKRSPDGSASISIDTIAGSESYRLAIAADAKMPPTPLSPASLTIAPAGTVRSGYARIVRLPSGPPMMVMGGLPPAALDQLSGASTATLKIGKFLVNSTAVAGSGKAIAALRKCEADQLVEWGADPAQFVAGGSTPNALKPRDNWFSDNQFLNFANLSKRSTIDDDFRVLIAGSGVIADCHAIAEITERDLEKSVCAALIGRKMFDSARDRGGKPVSSAASFHLSLIRRSS